MIAGAVLCGGASSRMGRDKATLEVGGMPMARWVANALCAGGCAPVVAVGGDPRALMAIGLAVELDLHPGEGPLGGIITALRWSPHPAVFVAACDVPRLSAGTVAAVTAAGGLAVACTEHRQPLCAMWPVAVLPQLEEAFAAGERQVRAVLDTLAVVEVEVPAADVRNINAPGDLAGGR